LALPVTFEPLASAQGFCISPALRLWAMLLCRLAMLSTLYKNK
jgi:hypothetical protein